MHSRTSLENYTRFQTKMCKIYTRFPDRNDAKTLPFGAAHTYYLALYEGVPPGPPHDSP